MDSPHLLKQQRQTEFQQQRKTESQQAAHLVTPPHSESYETQPERKKQDFNIVKSGTVETNNRIDRVKPVEHTNKHTNNDIETPNIPPLTENQIVPKDHANLSSQTDLEQDQFTGRESRATEAPLVPMPHKLSQNTEKSDASIKDFGYPIDAPQVSGKEGLQSPDKWKQQSRDESQTINVTIGRIEVRAVHPAPTPIKRERAKAKPALSLDDYLQQRQRGER